MSKLIKIRQLYETDADEVFDLIQVVGEEKKGDVTFPYSTNRGYYLDLIKNNYCVGCFLNDKLVSSFLTSRGTNELEICKSADLSDNEISKTLVFETCVVKSEFRGNKIQTRLGKEIYKSVQGYYKYFLSEVHKDNKASIRSLLKLGFVVYKEVDDKYIMHYNIK